jgi:RNA polymerase sigma-70 factor (ECF subfamily)
MELCARSFVLQVLERSTDDVFQKARDGDPAAFQEIIRPHLDSVRRFVFSMSSNWQDADDITQEALIKAFRAFRTFDGRAALSTWLYTVARSASIDWHRSRLGRAAQCEKPLPELHPSPEPGQDQSCSEKQEHARLWAAIQSLEDHSRVPLVLFEIEGLSYEEIAAVEAIPVGTVRSRLSRARQQLRELLAQTSLVPQSGVEQATRAATSLRSSGA